MIAKLVKGKGFRGALEYDLGKQGASLLITNMAGITPRTLAREFGAVRKLRPNLGKAVCHVSISLPPKESLTDEKWCEIAQKYAQAMGFEGSQYVATKHTDTEHAHIHIIASRITMQGEVVSDSNDFRKQEKLMRQLEQEYGLQVVPNSRDSPRKTLSKNEVEQALRTGKTPLRMQLQTLVDAALHTQCSIKEFQHKLAQHGVEVCLKQSKTGEILGISFSLDGVAMSGSSLGRGYAWQSLTQRGLYEQNEKTTEFTGRGSGRNNHDAGPCRDTQSTGATQNRKHYGTNNPFGKIEKSNRSLSKRRGKIRTPGQGVSR